jgi:feruloyl-CoA synthase
MLTTSLLSTEVSVGLNRWWPTEDHDVLGLPGPGADIKLVPLGDGRYELRPRGAGVTPGYIGDPTLTEEAFDEEGYFYMGDAVRFRDPNDRGRGLCFAGRVAEDFKLLTGTWVQPGSLRPHVVAAASPLVRDAVICGLNERELTALLWLNPGSSGELAQGDDPARSTAVRQAITDGLMQHNAANPASSTSITRFLILDEPPDPTKNEVTEKGYINQQAVRQHRASDIARLYESELDEDVIQVPRQATPGMA